MPKQWQNAYTQHLQDSIHFLHFSFFFKHQILVHNTRFCYSRDWISISYEWISSWIFANEWKTCLQSVSWCKHSILICRPKGKKNISRQRSLNAQFFCRWKRNLIHSIVLFSFSCEFWLNWEKMCLVFFFWWWLHVERHASKLKVKM